MNAISVEFKEITSSPRIDQKRYEPIRISFCGIADLDTYQKLNQAIVDNNGVKIMNKEQIFEDGDIYLEIASAQVYREETDDYLVYVAGLYAPIAGSYTDRCLIADYDAIQD